MKCFIMKTMYILSFLRCLQVSLVCWLFVGELLHLFPLHPVVTILNSFMKLRLLWSIHSLVLINNSWQPNWLGYQFNFLTDDYLNELWGTVVCRAAKNFRSYLIFLLWKWGNWGPIGKMTAEWQGLNTTQSFWHKAHVLFFLQPSHF